MIAHEMLRRFIVGFEQPGGVSAVNSHSIWCVPPGILCAPNKMTSSQMEWLARSHRSGSEREDLKGASDVRNESLNSFPPFLGTLRGREIPEQDFLKADPGALKAHQKWVSEHS